MQPMLRNLVFAQANLHECLRGDSKRPSRTIVRNGYTIGLFCCCFFFILLYLLLDSSRARINGRYRRATLLFAFNSLWFTLHSLFRSFCPYRFGDSRLRTRYTLRCICTFVFSQLATVFTLLLKYLVLILCCYFKGSREKIKKWRQNVCGNERHLK